MSDMNPYASSDDAASAGPHSEDAWVYRSAQTRMSVLTVLFSVTCFWQLIMLGMTVTAVVADVDDWGDFEFEGMLYSKFWLSYAALGLINVPVYLVTVVVFCMWIYRCNANARALGAQGMEFTPGWCCGWFFVPIAHLFKPYQAVRETWQASHPDTGSEDWGSVEDTGPVSIWWGFWIGSSVLSNIEARLSDSESPNMIEASNWAGVLSSLTGFVLCLVAIRMVRSLQERQTAKAERLGITG